MNRQYKCKPVVRKIAPTQVPGFTGISMSQLNHIIQHKLGMRPVPASEGRLFLKTVNSKLFVCVAPGNMFIAGGLGSSITTSHPQLFSADCKSLINSADVLFLPVAFYPVMVKQIIPAKRSPKKRATIFSKLFKGEMRIPELAGAGKRIMHNIGYLVTLEKDNGTPNMLHCDCCETVSRLARFCINGVRNELAKLLGKKRQHYPSRTETPQGDFCIDKGCALPMLYYMEMKLKGQGLADVQPFTDQETVMRYFHQIWSVMRAMTLEVKLDRAVVAAHLPDQNQVKIEAVEEEDEIHSENAIVKYGEGNDSGVIIKVEELLDICDADNRPQEGESGKEINCVYRFNL